MHFARLLTATGLVLGAAALVLQFSLSIPATMANGSGLGRSIVLFFSYFTILTNAVLVLIYLSELLPARVLAAFRGPLARALMAGTITLVMAYYHVFLLAQKRWDGLWFVADILLHYTLPLLYLLWWTVTQPHGGLRFKSVPAMIVPPLAYLPYVMLLGVFTGVYPYAVIDLNNRSAAEVGTGVLAITLALALLCALVVAADQALAGKASPGRVP